MKQLKKLKNVHKQLLNKNGYNARDYKVERDTTEQIVFMHKFGVELTFIKNEGVFR